MQSRRTALSFALAATVAATLAACGGSSDSVPTATLNVTPSLGVVLNADVTVLNSTGGILGTGTTGSTGKAAIQLFGSVSGPLVVKLTSNANTTYFNEKGDGITGRMDPIPAGSSLFSIVPTLPASNAVGVTSLTNMAAKLAGVDATTLSTLSTLALDGTKVTTAVAKTLLIVGLPTNFNILAAPVPATEAIPVPSDTYGKLLAVMAKNSTAANPIVQATALVDAVNLNGTVASVSAFTDPTNGINSQLIALSSQTGVTTVPAITSPTPLQITNAVAAVSSSITSGTAPTGGTGGTGATGASGSLSSL